MPYAIQNQNDLFKNIAGKFPKGKSGFKLSSTNREGLEWRLMLINMAKYSIDMQYFLWHTDMIGRLLLLRLLEAADRGVRIQLLVDDLPLETNNDGNIAAIDAHNNIDIKIFNPTNNRFRPRRLVEMVTHAGRLNHRMHNKLLIVDEAAAIVGGRNIGDEYFGLNSNMNFIDLDALVVGPHVALASNSFTTYWQSKWSIDAKIVMRKEKSADPLKIQGVLRDAIKQKEQILAPLENEAESWKKNIEAFSTRFVPGAAVSIQDDPSEMKTKNMSIAGARVDHIAEGAEKELCISSPYFIPSGILLNSFRKLAGRGVNVRILTNSIMTNNHISAHSGYIKFRKKVLKLDIQLFELHHTAILHELYDTQPINSGILCLHAKTVIVDKKNVFIGSLNFDPRAIYLNSEMGFLIDSPALVDQASHWFQRLIAPDNSWRLSLAHDKKIHWTSDLGECEKEPMRDLQQKMQLLFLHALPIEKQL